MTSAGDFLLREGVRQEAQHVLFVEGDENSIDTKVLGRLFAGNSGIRIRSLGTCNSIRSVAQALFRHHPTYYFLIDRDYEEDREVEESWSNFPDTDKRNLLIWRRRSIENYFLDPGYLAQSGFCTVSEDVLRDRILGFVNERLLLDVANHAAAAIQREISRNWHEGIPRFSDPDAFPDPDAALKFLVGEYASGLQQHRKEIKRRISAAEIEGRWGACLERATGGQYPVVFGLGDWLRMVRGKGVFGQILNSECFTVRDSRGEEVQGAQKRDRVAEDLLRKDASVQPDDFAALRQLIGERMQ